MAFRKFRTCFEGYFFGRTEKQQLAGICLFVGWCLENAGTFQNKLWTLVTHFGRRGCPHSPRRLGASLHKFVSFRRSGSLAPLFQSLFAEVFVKMTFSSRASKVLTLSEKFTGHAKAETHLKLQDSMTQFSANC